MWQLWMQILLLALLMACLLCKHHRRARRPVADRELRGRAFDASALQARIHRLRKDYVAAVRARPPQSPSREKVAASIRQTLRRLAYFQGEQTDRAADVTHETSTGRR